MGLLLTERIFHVYKWLRVLWLAMIVVSVAVLGCEEQSFIAMSPEAHLSNARNASRESVQSIDASLRHLAAIPDGSPETPAAKQLATELRIERAAIEETFRAKKQMEVGRSTAMSLLASDLMDLGFRVSVERSGTRDEITITSSALGEAAQRARLLASLQGRIAPTYSVCWQGFTKVRLRSSRIPFIGFHAVQKLDCDSALFPLRSGRIVQRP